MPILPELLDLTHLTSAARRAHIGCPACAHRLPRLCIGCLACASAASPVHIGCPACAHRLTRVRTSVP
eukprot:9041119-Pyramimonas_sp.AAC.1